MHHKGRKSITILEIMKTMVKDMVKLPIFLGKEIFLDFSIIKEVLVIGRGCFGGSNGHGGYWNNNTTMLTVRLDRTCCDAMQLSV